MEDDNDILIEYDILKAIRFNVGISGTTSVLVDAANIFGKRDLKKTNFEIRTGAWVTHEVCWREYLVEVTKSSNVSVPEIIPLTKLQRCAKNDLFVNGRSIIKSVHLSLCMNEGRYKEPVLDPTDDIYNKNASYLAALQHIEITQKKLKK